MYGLKTQGKTKKEVKADRKRTKFMTNSIEIAEQLQRRCKGDHEHQWLTGKRASEAARYPEGLCRAICIGLMKELRNKDQKIMPLLSVCHDTKIGEIHGSE